MSGQCRGRKKSILPEIELINLNERSLGMVANVNKPSKSAKTDKAHKSVTQKSPKKRKSNSDSQGSNDSRQGDGQKKRKRNQSADQTVNLAVNETDLGRSTPSQNDEFKASFQEGEAMIQMGVNSEEDELYADTTRSEEDSEVEFQNLPRNNRNNIANSQVQKGQLANDEIPNTPEGRKRRIQQIDQEMKTRLLELKRLMAQDGGFAESSVIADGLIEQQGEHEFGNSNENAVIPTNITTRNKRQVIDNSKSEETIYRKAIQHCPLGRLSSSSEEDVDSSTEIVDMNQIIISFAEGGSRNVREHKDAVLETSQQDAKSKPTPEDHAEKLIKEAELAKGKICATGSKTIDRGDLYDVEHAREMLHSILVDEEYSAVRGHLDETIIGKIKRGEYVDFAKLLPKDRVAIEEANRIQPIFKDGQVLWQTPSESNSITSYTKWEQAFKVFAKIYTKYHPHRASELMQYSNDIHVASLTYIWENVYLYNKEFRLHLSKHLMRSWGLTLQHAWNLKMKDQIGSIHQQTGSEKGRNNWFAGDGRLDRGSAKQRISKPCKRYNRGKCNFGTNCKYEHRCQYCMKFGHKILVCRKLNNDKDHKWTKNSNREGCKSPEGKSFQPNNHKDK